MKVSASNIGWEKNEHIRMYQLMKKYGFSGLEIAPTKLFLKDPYEKVKEAILWSDDLKESYGLVVSSIQSIWYGRQENLFCSMAERNSLIEYTKMAISFAEAIKCENIVFGCPRNRNCPDNVDSEIAIPFFKDIGEYAAAHHVVVALEANPSIYDTNYINKTKEAFEMVKKVDSKGFLVNLDVGAMLYNKESIEVLEGNVNLIHHVHISEPNLQPIEKRKIHLELAERLKKEKYNGFVSIEMGRLEDDFKMEAIFQYIKEVFGGKGV